MKTEDKLNPDHYDSGGMQAVEVIEEFFPFSAHLSQAFKYMARAGRKSTESEMDDLRKARWWLDRHMEFIARCE